MYSQTSSSCICEPNRVLASCPVHVVRDASCICVSGGSIAQGCPVHYATLAPLVAQYDTGSCICAGNQINSSCTVHRIETPGDMSTTSIASSSCVCPSSGIDPSCSAHRGIGDVNDEHKTWMEKHHEHKAEKHAHKAELAEQKAATAAEGRLRTKGADSKPGFMERHNESSAERHADRAEEHLRKAELAREREMQHARP
eukprot:GILJ01010665.1.p1 GENE.GILJ01010665.1~~GILJ01010665.1.p1  ORF type:complete len:199 (+),score=21.91 GILJ01010665.1:167-763(+)